MACSRLLPYVLALTLLSLSIRPSCPRTLLLSGPAESERPAPVLHVGDSVLFEVVDLYDLYMFHSKSAFDLCIFAQASLLHGTRSSTGSYFMWHPSRPGSYYFSYRNRSLDACDSGERVEAKVLPAPEVSPTLSPIPAPPPSAGDDDGGGFFPSLPHESRAATPTPSPRASIPLPGNGRVPSTAAAPSAFPGPGGGMPFISSNPALPLPTGEADATASRPLPVAGYGHPVVGKAPAVPMTSLVSLVTTPFALWALPW